MKVKDKFNRRVGGSLILIALVLFGATGFTLNLTFGLLTTAVSCSTLALVLIAADLRDQEEGK